jgi:hypothetical protein
MHTLAPPRARRSLLLAALSFALPLAVHAESPAPAASASGSELLFEETFNRGTHVNGWFTFGGGKNFTFRGDVIPFAGQGGTNAFVFTANAEAYEEYWFGGIGRNHLATRPGTGPENLALVLDLASLGSEKNRVLSIRLIQGEPSKTTWSATFKPSVSRAFQTVTLRLHEGVQTGAFDPEKPLHLHAITFGNGSFGAEPDVQVAVDNVRLFARRP